MSFKRQLAKTEKQMNRAGLECSAPDSARTPHDDQGLRTDILTMAEISFAHSFALPGFDGQLPPGRYEFEVEIDVWRAYAAPTCWKDYILLHLHNPAPEPGMPTTLDVRLTDFESALARDALRGSNAQSAFLDGMLANPLVRLLMEADRVSETELRHLFAGMPVKAETDPAMQYPSHPAEPRCPDGSSQTDGILARRCDSNWPPTGLAWDRPALS